MNYIPKYFAAANGYSGFRSYFGEIFAPQDFDRIYVLKGGPGTGKSSFMKRLCGELQPLGFRIEEILCSSDPNSLDGLIAENGEKKIAVIDGTAPHERDATVPGACDEIINLADALDYRWLRAEREKILSLNKEKKKAYKTAYFYLAQAGHSTRLYADIFAESHSAKNAISAIKDVAELTSEAKLGNSRTRLIEAFCKTGRTRLDTFDESSKKLYTIVGNEQNASFFLSELSKALSDAGIEFIHSPSPLNQELTDAIFIPSIDVAFTIGSDSGIINADEFAPLDDVSRERVRRAEEIHRLSTEESVRWFSLASEIHFALEDIYTAAMDFGVVDKIYSQKSKEIISILS